ncbi:MAG: ATP-grasp domain-containing protein [Chloroflexota bacterium]
MDFYDLCLASNWEYDDGFIEILDGTCRARGRRLLTVTPSTLAETLSRLSSGEAGFRALLDRASEADSSYLPLVDIARSLGARRFNPRELADRAYDKATVHHLFLEDGIPTPRTIILPAYLHQSELPPLDLQPLGGNFTVKPALGGGGDGVIMEISTPEQIQSARQHFPEQQYLLQEHVTPKMVDGLPAWFRVIFCLDEIFVTYWNTATHVYTPVGELGGRAGLSQTILGSLREVTRRIARLCELDLFSTEIALTEDDRLLVVDYINDPIDLRLQSRAADGVPNFIVERIAAQIAEAIQIQNAP